TRYRTAHESTLGGNLNDTLLKQRNRFIAVTCNIFKLLR
ncbi:hypothetical protein D020_3276B, partial [Vibrio parahaemolyticus SBR10290]